MMNTEQRRRHLSQVQSTQVAEANEGFSPFDASDPAATEAISVTNPVLSVDLESASEQVNIPIKCLEGIWTKASELINTNDAIAPGPGQDSGARMVLSYSGKVPHMVTLKKGGEFSCDSSCPNWKSSPWEFVHIVWLLRSIRNCHCPMYPMCYPFGQDTLLWMEYPLQQNPVSSFTLCFITGTSLPVLAARTSIQNNPKCHMTYV